MVVFWIIEKRRWASDCANHWPHQETPPTCAATLNCAPKSWRSSATSQFENGLESILKLCVHGACRLNHWMPMASHTIGQSIDNCQVRPIDRRRRAELDSGTVRIPADHHNKDAAHTSSQKVRATPAIEPNTIIALLAVNPQDKAKLRKNKSSFVMFWLENPNSLCVIISLFPFDYSLLSSCPIRTFSE